jgi:hypothetical protein
MARPVDVTSFTSQLRILGEARRRKEQERRQEEDRKAAEKTNRLRNLGMIAGAVVGGFAGGPAGVAIGSQLGSTGGALLAQRQGGQEVSNRELIGTTISAASGYQQYQQQQQVASQNAQANAAFASNVDTTTMDTTQKEQFNALVSNEQNMTADPRQFRETVFAINPELRKPQVYEVEGQRFATFPDGKTIPISETRSQITAEKLAASGEELQGLAEENEVSFTQEELGTIKGQTRLRSRVRTQITENQKNQQRLAAVQSIISALPEDSPTRISAQKSLQAATITPVELSRIESEASKERVTASNTALAKAYGIELPPEQMSLPPSRFQNVIKAELAKKEATTAQEVQTENNTAFGSLMASRIDDAKLKSEIANIPKDQRSSIYQSKVAEVQSKYINSFEGQVNKEKNLYKKAAAARNASIELAEVSHPAATKFAQLAGRLERQIDRDIARAEKQDGNQMFNKVVLQAEAEANKSTIKTLTGKRGLTKSEKAAVIVQRLEPHTRLARTEKQREAFKNEVSRQKRIFFTNKYNEITTEREARDARTQDTKEGLAQKQQNKTSEIEQTKDLVAQMDRALDDPTINEKDKQKIENERTAIINDFTDGVVNAINETQTEDQANAVIAAANRRFENLLEQEKISEALDSKVASITVPVEQEEPKVSAGTQRPDVEAFRQFIGLSPAARIADAQTAATGPGTTPPVATGNLATAQNTPPVSFTTAITQAGNAPIETVATTQVRSDMASRVLAEVPDVDVTPQKVEALSMAEFVELRNLMEDPIKNRKAIQELLK